jgi:hypothetical protein
VPSDLGKDRGRTCWSVTHRVRITGLIRGTNSIHAIHQPPNAPRERLERGFHDVVRVVAPLLFQGY